MSNNKKGNVASDVSVAGSLKKSGWWILTILSLVPLALWFFQPSLNLRFSDALSLTRSLGDVLGLCGMAMFSLVLILSARLKIFEKFFKGINETYTAHHVFGGLAFCLLLFHPLFLAYDYFTLSFHDAALFLLPSASNWPQNYGIIGLVIMILALVITFYTRFKYQFWKFTHKFLGLAFIFAFLHVFLIGGDLLFNQPLKIYLFILGILGIAAYLYRVFFSDYLVRNYKYVIKEVKEDKDKIWEITFEPKNRTIKFAPGQFAFVKLFSKELTKEIHPFSFSSANGNPLKIAIKELGDYTNKIGSLKVGDIAAVEGPFGAFSFRNFSNKKQVWIAGGVGVTPFLSMLRNLTYKDADYKIDLYYSAKDENCLAFKDEIQKIADKNKNLNVKFWTTDKMGFLNAGAIKNNNVDLLNYDILVCGPPIMMNAFKKQFLDMGILKDKIHMEEFNLY